MRRFVVVAAALAMGGLSLAGCGSDDEDATPAAFEVTQTGAAPSVSGPDSVEGGVIELSVKNSTQAPVDLQLLRVTGDQSVDDVLKVLESEGGPIPDYLKAGGGVGTTPPGQTGTATVEVDEGKYYVIASVESDAEPGPAPASKTLEVEGDGGSLPDADGTVTAKEYTFETDGLKAGANTVKFENTGAQLHHLIAAPLAQGATIDQVKQFVTTEGEPQGPPPLDFESAISTAVVESDHALVTNLELKAGKYAFICFISDRAGGPPHAAKGMVTEVTIS